MKKLLVLVVCSFMLIVTSRPAVAIEYSLDFLESGNLGGWSGSLKTFDNTWTLSPGSTVDVDIWLSDLPECIYTAGAIIQFNPALVDIISVVPYETPIGGPWDPGLTSSLEVAYGEWFLTLGNLGTVAPDGDGDIILAKVTFKCQGPGNAEVTVSTVPGFETVVGCSATVYDPSISPKIVTITQPVEIDGYSLDFLEAGNLGGWSGSLKTFDNTWTLSPGSTVEVDIWLRDLPESIAAGCFIEYDPALVDIINVVPYETPIGGPWDPGATTSLEVTPGEWLLTVAQFSCVTSDGDGDIILAKATFQCQGPGNANVTVSTIPGFDTVVNCGTTVWDPYIAPKIVTITQDLELDICEGDLDNDKDVDADDVTKFLEDFGRSPFNNPCP